MKEITKRCLRPRESFILSITEKRKNYLIPQAKEVAKKIEYW